MAARVCRFLIVVYLLCYLAALAMAIIGTRGLFGVERDGLSAVYLLFFGMPWTLALPALPLDSIPEVLGQILMAALPLINIFWLRWICRKRRKRKDY